ncbi:MSHA biogenesis protein MshJ [Noviherbaspirillum sp. ST9]|uniref:MSHA biogenesis protein MshJ n=1 Tax=Noviherbaspirillum sp. ST9 TaxID=3401606 RepID=UPI003B5884B3
MKQRLILLAKRIDGMTLRERGVIFAASAVVLFSLFNSLVWDRQAAKQKRLQAQIQDNQQKAAEVQTQILQKAYAIKHDPDAQEKARLKELEQRIEQARDDLSRLQMSLVSPDKMPDLLEGILKRQGGLKLVSMKSLPPELLNQPQDEVQPPAQKLAATLPVPGAAAKPASPARGVIYKHGVELVVQGGYTELMGYLVALENVKWQLFWGRAKLNSTAYPAASLTLTLYTLSTDEKWLNL